LVDIGEKRGVVEAIGKAVDQSSFVLKENPELTFSQIYNRTKWRADKNKLFTNKLHSEEKKYKRPWLKFITKPSDTSALIRTLTGHTDYVKACAFSPDGKRIVSASRDHTLKLWDAETGKELNTLKGHT
jgi:WD40 repeat protein